MFFRKAETVAEAAHAGEWKLKEYVSNLMNMLKTKRSMLLRLTTTTTLNLLPHQLPPPPPLTNQVLRFRLVLLELVSGLMYLKNKIQRQRLLHQVFEIRWFIIFVFFFLTSLFVSRNEAYNCCYLIVRSFVDFFRFVAVETSTPAAAAAVAETPATACKSTFLDRSSV